VLHRSVLFTRGYFNLSILGLILGPNQRLYVLLSEGCVEIKAIDAHVLRN